MSTRLLAAVLIAAVCFVNRLAVAATGVAVINVSADQAIDAPRWMYDGQQAKGKGSKLIALLIESKKALMAKDHTRCLNALQKAYPLGKGLGPWLAWNQLQCAQLRDKKDYVSIPALTAAIKRIEDQPKWLLFGPSAAMLKSAYTSAILLLAEQQIKNDRRTAWKTLDKLQQVRPWLSLEERASADRWTGELAFVEQNLAVAQDFLMRSLGEKDSAELRARVESIRASLNSDKPEKTDKKDKVEDTQTAAAKAPPPTPNPELGISDEERELFGRMTTAYEAQDYVSAIEDGVQLLQKYPGSRHATDAAERILEIYVALSSHGDEKYRHVRDSVVHEMEKVDSGHMAKWANNAYAHGNYLDALVLSEKSYNKYGGHPDGTKMLLLAGKAAFACGQYSDAANHFERLLRESGGSSEAVEATFRLGLLQFRNRKFAPAAAYFERLLALSGSKDYEYRALYWQWRAQQFMDPSKAAPFAKPLIDKYPLSYYGLRAKAELNGGNLDLSDEAVPLKVELRLLDNDRLAWERMNILLNAGWLKEAEKELESLPPPQNATERVLRAKLWASALRYDLAIINLNKAMDENPDMLQSSLLKIVFPKEFEAWIARESQAVGISENWIRSLIRQESTFRPDAKSASNALGVMQLLPATAQELVHDFKIKDFQVPESLFDPNINIKLGSNYLARMIKDFKGNIPLALAAYNAGPARLRRWLSARKDVASLESGKSSSPEVELWIDELPWDETSFYVKAILRNWLIYRLLDGAKVALTEPIWLDGTAVAR